MNYQVTWTSSAENKLARMWVDSRLSSQITAAVNRLDQLLASRPLDTGESRPANLRIAFDFPIAMLFFVDENSNEVIVIDIWLY